MMNDAAASLRYTDLRALVEHAAKRFPDTGFFLCADEKLPSVTGAELYSLCKRAAGVRRRKCKAKTRKTSNEAAVADRIMRLAAS